MSTEEMSTAQLRKIRAEIRHIGLQSEKLMMETRWYPFVIATGFVVAVITLTKLFL